MNPRAVYSSLCNSFQALGCVPPPPGYLAAMSMVCKKFGSLVIYDEVMCGTGRTGTLHCWEHDGVAPDIQVLGKGLGAGQQAISAMLCSQHIHDTIMRGSGFFCHGFTFQNHAISCSAALDVLQIIRSRGLLENVKRLGALLEFLLHQELDDHPHVGDIRGRGFFWGVGMFYSFCGCR